MDLNVTVNFVLPPSLEHLLLKLLVPAAAAEEEPRRDLPSQPVRRGRPPKPPVVVPEPAVTPAEPAVAAAPPTEPKKLTLVDIGRLVTDTMKELGQEGVPPVRDLFKKYGGSRIVDIREAAYADFAAELGVIREKVLAQKGGAS